MSIETLYDLVAVTVPDHDVILTLTPQAIFRERQNKKDVIHRGDDNDPNSETRLDFSGGKPTPYLTVGYNGLIESDKKLIYKFWTDPAYGCGKIYSFKFFHPDGHTYVVRFDSEIEISQNFTFWSISPVILLILGKILDP